MTYRQEKAAASSFGCEARYWGGGLNGQVVSTATLTLRAEAADLDGDGLPNAVELVLGTDPERGDTDQDELSDFFEARYELDPLDPDSNGDELWDYIEVTVNGVSDASRDLDDDGKPNIWDDDNDNDGVRDGLDPSPLSKSGFGAVLEFRVHTNGNPTYLDLQLRPADASHLRLPPQVWDWPDDYDGQMQDADHSREDLTLVPMLEFEASQLPAQADVDSYGITVNSTDGKAYVPLSQVLDNGNPVAFQGRMFFPASAPLDLVLKAKLVWMVRGEVEKFGQVPFEPYRATPVMYQNAGPYNQFTGTGGEYFLQDGNDAGGAALADLNGNGTLDLLLSGVCEHEWRASPWGGTQRASHLCYRVGWDLDDTAAPSSWSDMRWSPAIELGAGYEHYLPATGSGVAIAQLGGIQNLPDLVFMGIAYSGNYKKARFWYQVGYDVGASGDVNAWGGFTWAGPDIGDVYYTPVAYVTGGGAAIGDINGDNKLDLLLLGSFTHAGQRKLLYRIGWGTGSGQYNWSDALASPASLPIPQLSGAGAELADLNDNGKQDLVLTGVKYVFGGDEIHYAVAWDLDSNGQAAHWTPWRQVGQPLGASYATQRDHRGGGAAVGDIDDDGKLDLLVSATYRPDNPTQGRFKYSVGWGFAVPVQTTLSRYEEAFALTSLRAEENLGSEVGLFYSADKEQTVRAQMALRYEFMQGPTSLAQVPGMLAANTIAVSHKTGAYGHHDAALQGAQELSADAVEELSAGQVLPIAYAFQDVSADVSLDSLVSGSYIVGSPYELNVRAQKPVTVKAIRMLWYDTDTDEPLEEEALPDLVSTWNYDDDEENETLKLLLVWQMGEQQLVKVDDKDTYYQPPEKDAAMTWVKTGAGGLRCVAMLPYMLNGIGFLRMARVGGSGFGQALAAAKAYVRIITGAKGAAGGVARVQKIIGHTLAPNQLGRLAKWARAAKALRWLGIVVGVAMAGYAFYQIADQLGWSATGIMVAAIYASAMMVYFIALEILASFGLAGAIIAALVILSDLLSWAITGSGWSDMVLNWMLGGLLKVEVEAHTDIDLAGTSSKLEIKDFNDNGLDVGDYIRYWASFHEQVTRTSAGNWWSVREDHLTPSIIFDIGPGYPGFETHTQADRTEDFVEPMDRDHDLVTWVRLQAPAINVPLNIKFTGDYKVHYSVSQQGVTEEVVETGTKEQVQHGMYFDVLPGSLNAVASWSAIHNLDPDGDGLLTQGWSDQEVDADGTVLATNAFSWDTDGDRLSDKFELDIESDPTRADSDGDLLPDGVEVDLGTDPNAADSDSDGLTDYVEHEGWWIQFDFVGQHGISRWVDSDPLAADSDGDGLSDAEEQLKGLNPQSIDTDGDGVFDPWDPSAYQAKYIKAVGRNAQVSARLNGHSNSLQIGTGQAIAITFDYQVIGKERDPDGIPGPPGTVTCTIEAYVDNPDGPFACTYLGVIYRGNPGLHNIAEGSKTFTVTAASAQTVYYVRAWALWSDTVGTPSCTAWPVVATIVTEPTAQGLVGWSPSAGDSDGDGIPDKNEEAGWVISFRNRSGSQTLHVTSDWGLPDTDYDGLSDLEESQRLTNPNVVDTDGDGLSDREEVTLGTDPLDWDKDADELSDGEEVTFGSSTTLADTDGDGLTDPQELELGSNPNSSDTDGDELTDLQEHNRGTSLVAADPDGDGLTDKQETERVPATDPWNPDSDEDGLSDGDEVQRGTGPLDDDSDNDGLLDGDEVALASNPLNAAPVAEAGGPYAVPEGGSVPLSGSSTDPDSAPSSMEYWWDLDGNGGFETLGQNPQYSAAGLDGPSTVTVTMRVWDEVSTTVSGTVTTRVRNGGEDTDTGFVTVTNVPPTVTPQASQAVNEGAPTSFALGSFSDPGASDGPWAVDVDWGDGSAHAAFNMAAQGALTPQTHTYADGPNAHTVTVRVTDKDGGFDTKTFVVTVVNVPPTVSAGPDATLSEAGTFASSGSFADPGEDTWTATVDYGDGAGVQPLALSANKTFALSHTYVDDNPSATPKDVYKVTVTVTDDDGGIGTDEVQVTVNNVPPELGPITAPIDPVQVNTPVLGTAGFSDRGTSDTHSAVWDWDYGNWGAPATSVGSVTEANGLGTVAGSHPYALPGVYTLRLTVTDDDTGQDSEEYRYVVIYDPEGGFVTGGGWIMSPAGAYVREPSMTGKATFGFVSKYQKGKTEPVGQTEFAFSAGNLNFHSGSYEWLVLAGARAKCKGVGTINSTGSYGFMLSAIDGQVSGGGGVDKFRIKIWDKNNGDSVVYDNQIHAADDADPSTPLAGGSIVIHTDK